MLLHRVIKKFSFKAVLCSNVTESVGLLFTFPEPYALNKIYLAIYDLGIVHSPDGKAIYDNAMIIQGGISNFYFGIIPNSSPFDQHVLN